VTENGRPDPAGQHPQPAPLPGSQPPATAEPAPAAGHQPADPAPAHPADPTAAHQAPGAGYPTPGAGHQALAAGLPVSPVPGHQAPAQPGTWAFGQPQQPYPGPVVGVPAHTGAVPPGGSLPPTAGLPTGGSTAGPGAAPRARRSSALRIGLAGLVAGAVIGGGAGAGVVALMDQSSRATSPVAAAQDVVIHNPQTATTATAAAAKAAPSVVTIYVSNGSGAGSGSGIVLTDDGYVLTNNHVVTLEGSGTGSVQVRTADGTLYDAKVVGTDASSDLAVVKLSGAGGLTAATFADSDKVQVGDVAVAIGAPLGLSNTVTDGIISATNRAVATGSTRNDSTVIDAIQTDAAINPGNSGGALVNGAGQVIGVNTAIASVASEAPGQQSQQSGNIGVGFAIPANTAQRIAQEIIKTGSANHAVLGVSARTATDAQNPEVGTGAQVVQVQPGSGASAAGLQAGDVITALGNRPVTDSTELTAAVRSSDPGEKVTLTVRHGNGTHKVDVTLGTTG
jgi:S1-C subfamily serine protease